MPNLQRSRQDITACQVLRADRWWGNRSEHPGCVWMRMAASWSQLRCRVTGGGANMMPSSGACPKTCARWGCGLAQRYMACLLLFFQRGPVTNWAPGHIANVKAWCRTLLL
eukprot:1681618-Karenia_brevis.AAC.1